LHNGNTADLYLGHQPYFGLCGVVVTLSTCIQYTSNPSVFVVLW